MYRLILILIFSFIFTQDVCEGTCFSEEEVLNITNNIKELQFDIEKYKEIETNLNLQIKDYMKDDSLNVSLIDDYKKMGYNLNNITQINQIDLNGVFPLFNNNANFNFQTTNLNLNNNLKTNLWFRKENK